ncbi:MAG: hypothetical protein R6X10_09160 [Desulfobacterales bacterium]
MIIDIPEAKFIFVYHPLVLMGRKYTVYNGKEMTNGEVLKYWGKWLVIGELETLHSLAEKLDPFVEDKKIPCIKYDRKPSSNLGLSECVMMVYCDFRNRDAVWEILNAHGVKLKAWVTEKETMQLWEPGGLLLTRWMASQNFNPEKRAVIEQDVKNRLEYIYNHPDEIFTGFEQ